MKFMASIHGIKMKDEPVATPADVESGSSTMFGDPEAYSHLSEAEREEKTNSMMGHFKGWANGSHLKSN